MDIATPLLTLGIIMLGAALLLTLAANYHASRSDPDDSTGLVSSINALLPQTQCAQCGYPGCRPYARAIAGGEAINLCPPGGVETIAGLANLLGQEPLPLDQRVGITTAPMVAEIREAECIGCTLCIDACPVDAIIGAQGLMHTVLTASCTGCDLCRPPCPVDCIDLVQPPLDSDPAGEMIPARHLSSQPMASQPMASQHSKTDAHP